MEQEQNCKELIEVKEEKLDKIIVYNAIIMMWGGIVLIITSCILYAIGITNVFKVGIISGAFIILVSFILIYIYNKPNRAVDTYYKHIAKMKQQEQIYELIQDCQSEQFKQKIIKKLL